MTKYLLLAGIALSAMNAEAMEAPVDKEVGHSPTRQVSASKDDKKHLQSVLLPARDSNTKMYISALIERKHIQSPEEVTFLMKNFQELYAAREKGIKEYDVFLEKLVDFIKQAAEEGKLQPEQDFPAHDETLKIQPAMPVDFIKQAAEEGKLQPEQDFPAHDETLKIQPAMPDKALEKSVCTIS